MSDRDKLGALQFGDIGIVFRADGRIETDFSEYDFHDDEEEDAPMVTTEYDPLFRSLLTAILFLPYDPEIEGIRDRLYEISKTGPVMAPPGELN